jgi:Pentapeptide repeats (8 copies)
MTKERSNPTSLAFHLLTSLKRTAKQTSIAAVIVAVVGYYFTYQDRIDSRQQTAWNVVRTALEWSENKKWGNIGQIAAIETLTRDCDTWWLNTPLKYLLGRDCADLKSLSLMTMDFGGLHAPGAHLSYGYFACSNFAAAQLRRSHLNNTSFMAATLAGADFSGADLTKSCLFLADISGAKFDKNTIIDDPRNLLKACITIDPETGGRRNIDSHDNTSIGKIADQIPACPIEHNRCGLLSERNGWSCGN